MKRFLFLTALTVFSSVQVLAQSNSIDFKTSERIDSRSRGFIGRVTPFVTLGSYEFGVSDGDSRLKPTQRFGFGAMSAMYARNQLSLEGGLAYLPVGTRLETSAPGFNATSLVDLDYFAVPFIGKRFFRNDFTGFYAKAALIPAYLLSAKSEVDVAGNGLIPINSSKTVDVEDSYKKFDVQGAIGVGGVFVANDVNRIFLDLTFGRSLATISKGGDIDVYNEGFLLSSGFTL